MRSQPRGRLRIRCFCIRNRVSHTLHIPVAYRLAMRRLRCQPHVFKPTSLGFCRRLAIQSCCFIAAAFADCCRTGLGCGLCQNRFPKTTPLGAGSYGFYDRCFIPVWHFAKSASLKIQGVLHFFCSTPFFKYPTNTELDAQLFRLHSKYVGHGG